MTSVLGTLHDTGQVSKHKLTRKPMDALEDELKRKISYLKHVKIKEIQIGLLICNEIHELK